MSVKCSEVNEDGLPCQKNLYFSSTGEYWDHAGGHVFASARTWDILKTEHYDAGKVLAGVPFSHHKSEDCPGEPECHWDRDHSSS